MKKSKREDIIVCCMLTVVFIVVGAFAVMSSHHERGYKEGYENGLIRGAEKACKDVNDISYFRTATCEVFRDE